MTSAIEKLGHMLDERGVDYETYGNDSFTETCWLDAAGKAAVFAECDDGDTSFACETWDFTPEQAIVATLGYSTCHDVWQDDPFANFKCSECNEELHYREKKRIACCPFCKREVVDA